MTGPFGPKVYCSRCAHYSCPDGYEGCHVPKEPMGNYYEPTHQPYLFLDPSKQNAGNDCIYFRPNLRERIKRAVLRHRN